MLQRVPIVQNPFRAVERVHAAPRRVGQPRPYGFGKGFVSGKHGFQADAVFGAFDEIFERRAVFGGVGKERDAVVGRRFRAGVEIDGALEGEGSDRGVGITMAGDGAEFMGKPRRRDDATRAGRRDKRGGGKHP